MSYFSSRYLRYETNANDNYLDYGEVVQVINDKLVNLNMGGTGYILEAVACEENYIPKLGDWATVEWRNGQPVAKGGTGIATGLRNINDTVKVVSTSDLATGVVNSDHIRTNTIEARHIQAYSIEANHITANAINANHIDVNTVQARHISANQINSDHISANSIKAEHIDVGEVNAEHISSDSIQSNHISANTINGAHINANSIQSQHISANSINSDHITTNAINSDHVSANSIDAGHIQADSINSSHISSNAVQAEHISANSVNATHIQADSINSEHISANSIKSEHIDAGSVNAEHISANSIQGEHISANTISANHIGTDAIEGRHIGFEEIDADHIRAGSITGDHISANSVQAGHISANSVQTGHISANTINGDHIKINTIDAKHIKTDSITSEHVSANTIQGEHISANTISGNHISANTIQGHHLTINSIDSGHIKADSINAGHISANSVQSEHVSANTIEAKHIKSDQVNANHISANSVQAEHISANSVQSNHVSANTINSGHIKADSINATHLSANSVQSEHVSANTIEAKHIKTDQVNANHISANSVQAKHISANSVEAKHVKADQINATHISANSVQSEHVSANTIQAGHISANAVQSQHVSANTIQAGHISANAVQTQHISANTIKGEHIQAGTIDTDKMTVGSKREGLQGQYFTYSPASGNSKFQAFKGTQIDSTIDFNWSSGSPSIVGQADNFSVRWQGFIFAPETGTYDFLIIADDSMRVVVDNKEVVNQIAYASNVEQSGSIQLTKDKWYPILVEMSEGSGGARAELRWRTPSLVREIIPAKYFTQGNTVIDGATITTGSITATHIKTGTITADSGIIGDLAITTAHIASGSITSAKIGNAEIKSIHIASGNIDNIHIKDATIEYSKINSVDAKTITVGQLTAGQIAANQITSDHISANSIQGDHIVANAIDSTHIKAGAITANEISAGSVTASKLEVGSVTGDVIRAGSISAHHISTVGLDAQQITVYNGATGETLIGSGFLRVDGLDVGVVRSDNLLANGLFMTASSAFGHIRDNVAGESIAGTRSNGIGGHKVWKIDMSTGAKVAEIDVEGKKPYGIAIHPSGNHAYVTVQGDNTVMQIDLANDLVGQSLNLPHGPSRIKWTGTDLVDHKHFFVLNTDDHDHNVPDTLTVIDAPPNSVGGDLYLHHNIVLGNNPVDFVLDGENRQAYITMGNQGDIVQLDMSSHDSSHWKVVGRLPITAYGTDVYHGGVDGTIGLNEVTGGDASAQYNKSDAGGHNHTAHAHGGYGTPDGTMKTYNARGIAKSTDPQTLYVVDRDNGELVIVDKMGSAPYNALVGGTNSAHITSSGHDHGGTEEPIVDTSASSPGDFRDGGESHGGGPGTYYVRYRIPVGDKPEFVQVVNGKIVVSVQGSNSIAIIDEQQILNEIQADRDYYGAYMGEGVFEKWNPFEPMRAIGNIDVINKTVGSRPTFIENINNRLYITLSGQNQVAEFDLATMSVVTTINTGANPRGFAITPDGQYMYVVNHGGVGELSFVYTAGPYIGDAFFGLEGGIVYQGAEYWTPDRTDWVYDASGNVRSYSTVEFRVNEPFLNEGGYSKLTAYGKDYQYALIEQDIYNVTNYSNGDNVVRYTAQRLVGNSGNTIFYPAHETWETSPAPNNIKIVEIVSGNRTEVTPATNQYTVYYGESSRIEFVSGTVGINQWVEADYTSKFNQYFQPHNGSVLIAVENGSSPNFSTVYEIDEFVPKFVVWDNQQTSNFTPTADGINEEYTGLEYSVITNRALGRTTVTTSKAPTSGVAVNVTDGDHMTKVTLASGLSYVQVDLGKKYMIGQLNIIHHHEETNNNRRYHQTKTQVSEDGVTWYTVYDSAVSGEYYEYSYHPVHDHYHMGKPITFNARPVRYVRDYANGWAEDVTGLSGTDTHWTEIEAFGDWELIEDKVFPSNSERAGQQIATNGKGFVQTNISKATISFDVAVEFTSWWYMTYIVGPEYGDVAIEMPTVMGGSHFLPQDSMYMNNIAHRHIMSFPPSNNIKEDTSKGIKEGKHRIIIRQESGLVTLDRVRLEDYQFFQKNSLSIPSTSSSTTFRRYKTVAEQAKWYEGTGRQSTEGAYDKPRVSPDTGLPDKSVPIKYRVRVMSELNANGTVEERGITYVTSAIFETGKQHTHWRPSASSDSYPASKIEKWDANQPHKTGIQSAHIAHGAIKGPKIMTGAIMDYHISNYARISEHKLDLNHPTHRHGRMNVIVGAGPMGTDLHIFESNHEFLDSLEGFSGNGISNTVARGDHDHDSDYLALTGGVVNGDLTVNGMLHMGTNEQSATTMTFDGETSASLKVANANGYIQLTPLNNGWAHIYTDRPNFIFNRAVYNIGGGGFSSYTNEDLYLKRAGVTKLTLGATSATFANEVQATTFRKSDGTEVSYAGHRHDNANSISDGFMSKEDFAKLQGVAISANNYIHPTTAGNKHIPNGGASGNALKWGSTGTAKWENIDWSELTGKPATFAPSTHIHANANATNDGFMSNEDFNKLATVSVSANNYVHPIGDGNLHVPATGTMNSTKVLKAGSTSGDISWDNVDWSELTGKPTSFTPSTHGHSNANSTTDGFMSSGNYVKLSNIEEGAINQTTADGRYVNSAGDTMTGMLKFDNRVTDGVYPSTTNGFEWLLSSDGAYMYVQEKTGDIIDYVFKMRDNTTGDRFVFWIDDYRGEEYDAYPLIMTGARADVGVPLYVKGNQVWDTASLNKAEFATSGHIHSNATSSGNGFMSKEDFSKLQGVAISANNYIHPTGDGNLHVPATGTSNNGKVIKAGSTSGSISWANVDWDELTGKPSSFTPSTHIHANANGTNDGFMSKEDFSKLATVAISANNYVHPSTHSLSMITETTSLKIMTSAERTKLSGIEEGANNYSHPTSHSLDMITETTAKKIMTSAERTKLAGIEDSANNYSHPTGDGNLHVPSTGTSNNGKVLKAGSTAGSLAWSSVAWSEVIDKPTEFTPSAHRHDNANSSADGFMSKEDYAKLLAIAPSANNYIHPSSHSLDMITETTSKKIMTSDERTKLAGIAISANNYVHPSSHSLSMITETTTLKIMTSDERNKLANIDDNANNYSHPTGAGSNHVPSGGTTANFIKWSSNGTGTWAKVAWNDIDSKPTSFTPSTHSHTASQITDLFNDIYTKSQVESMVNAKGDVLTSGSNIFHESNTFDNAGLAVKIQPSSSVVDTTKLFQINNASSTELFSVNYSGGVTINGDLRVTGVQTYAGTTTVDGDYTINGQLIVGGNSTLGDASTDKTIVNGTLEINGTLVEKEKMIEVMRFPIYGIAGDPEFQLENQTTFEEVIGHLHTFDPSNSALPTAPTGATRKYKLMVSYSTVGTTSPATLRIVQDGTTTEITSVALPTVNFTGSRGGTRTLLSPEFTTSFTGHTRFEAKCNNASTSLIVRYVEVIAYDYYA